MKGVRKLTRGFPQYNYTLSAALDAGTSVQAIIVYMLSLDNFVTWWGNSAIDSEHCTPGS